MKIMKIVKRLALTLTIIRGGVMRITTTTTTTTTTAVMFALLRSAPAAAANAAAAAGRHSEKGNFGRPQGKTKPNQNPIRKGKLVGGWGWDRSR